MKKALSKKKYLATMTDPMRFIEADDESVPPVSLGEYFKESILAADLVPDAESVDIHSVYATPSNDFCHVLLNWGVKNVFIVIVTQPLEQKIYGHYKLDLNSEYGLDDTYTA